MRKNDFHYASQFSDAPEKDIVIVSYDVEPPLLSASSRRAENKSRFELTRKNFCSKIRVQRGIAYIILACRASGLKPLSR